MTIPTHIRESPEPGCREDQASQEVGWGEGEARPTGEGGLLAPERRPALASLAPPRRASRWAAIQLQQPQREPGAAGGADRYF